MVDRDNSSLAVRRECGQGGVDLDYVSCIFEATLAVDPLGVSVSMMPYCLAFFAIYLGN